MIDRGTRCIDVDRLDQMKCAWTYYADVRTLSKALISFKVSVITAHERAEDHSMNYEEDL